MRKFICLLSLFVTGLLASSQLSAQCIPDTLTCVDTTGNPGEVCPADLPDAIVNVLYDETITIIPPAVYEIFSAQLDIFYIEIDSVLNLPPGIEYHTNADIFYPDTAYCIQLTGTPAQTGVFDLSIYITATVDLGGPLRYQVVDDTSLSIKVTYELGLEPNRGTEFIIIPNVPNPFRERTRLAFYTPKQEVVELHVYNILGSRVHYESRLSGPGKHDFAFDGSELPPGTYLYRVAVRDRYFSGKIMKIR